MSAALASVPSLAANAAVDEACRRIAPSWPLDRFIAVNPWWGWIDLPFDVAAGRRARLSGSTAHMPIAFYRAAWTQGRIDEVALAEALHEAGIALAPAQFAATLADDERRARSLPLLSDLVDGRRDLNRAPAWRDALTSQVSQYCAAYFDRDQADWRPAPGGFYAGWRRAIGTDPGVAWLMGTPDVARRARSLPDTPAALIDVALRQLALPEADTPDLLATVLLRIHGWAGWCAYLRWQARLEGGDDDHLEALLAIRLAWEVLLDDGSRTANSAWAQWQRAWQDTPPPDIRGTAAVWQRALEIAYQRPLARALAARRAPSHDTAAVHAFFCIDVRSEPFRRALESVDPTIRTSGFAGFFGVPLAYVPLGTKAARWQLPGLLAPACHATDTTGDADDDARIAAQRQSALGAQRRWRAFERSPAAAFPHVEALGLASLGRLVTRTLGVGGAAPAADRAGLDAKSAARLRPALAGADAGQRADLAHRVLQAMGLRRGFARLTLLVGHGSTSANNPHAAGLACGACGGHSGAVNARVLADLLNDASVREALAERGVRIPPACSFVAALHDTTTDEVTVYDEALPPALGEDLARLRACLASAGERVRAERAPALRLGDLAHRPAALRRALHERARDWAQTRPEWGLANNAALIAAPRSRTRGLDLRGRVFLHDYDAGTDLDGSVLELVMTAPMVVAHWINLQYYASTVDPDRYGSGNKVLHNVVGGRIGVFEGNGGDLRVGLPRQSVHDGDDWRHEPLRLAVYVEAHRASIERVLRAHESVRQLVHHRWLHLYRIEPEGDVVEAYREGAWTVVATA